MDSFWSLLGFKTAGAIVEWQYVTPVVGAAVAESLSAFPLSYTSASALAVALQLLWVIIAVTWGGSLVTGNCSQVDRLWSITPFVFVWHFMLRAFLDDGAGEWSGRLVLMAVLATLWGARLTFNFWRKGGYRSGEEDYRWEVLRGAMHPVLYQVFNLTFISFYQHVLLFLLVVPAYVAYEFRHEPLNVLDLATAVVFLLFLALETVADQQQWVFYQTKYASIAKKERLAGDYRAGFNRSGLFAYSRHPNFFAEQAIWCTFYMFSVTCSGVTWNPSVMGAVLLMLLFQGSTKFTESITVAKYPAYADYQQTVSRLVPWFPMTTSKKVTSSSSKTK